MLLRSPVLALAALTLTAATAHAQSAPQPSGQELTLDGAIRIALERNHEVIATSVSALQAQQGYAVARGNILPNLNFNASAGRVRSGGGQVIGTFVNPVNNQTVTEINPTVIYGSYNIGLTVTQLVFDGGAWWNNLDAAKLNFQSQQETAEEQRLQTTYQVTQAFFELVRAQKQLVVFQEAARRSRDQADFEEKLYNGGKAAQSDVYAARANRDNDEINRLSGEALVETNRFALGTLLSLDLTQVISVVEPNELRDLPPTAPVAQAAIDKALSTRPSLLAFQHLLDSTRKTTAATRGRYLPTVNVQASFQRGTRDIGDLVAPPDEKSQLSGSVNLTWNLFNGFSDEANIERSVLQERSNENDLAQGRRQVASDVQTAIANLNSARQRAQVASQSEETARQGLTLARARQAVGLGTELDVRDAELKLTQAQLAHLNALVDGREQVAALKRAMGSDPSALGAAAPDQTQSAPPRNIGG